MRENTDINNEETKNKTPRNKLNQSDEDVTTETYETLLKEINEDLKKRRYGLEDLILLRGH
jgi:hypothetical protein